MNFIEKKTKLCNAFKIFKYLFNVRFIYLPNKSKEKQTKNTTVNKLQTTL